MGAAHLQRIGQEPWEESRFSALNLLSCPQERETVPSRCCYIHQESDEVTSLKILDSCAKLRTSLVGKNEKS